MQCGLRVLFYFADDAPHPVEHFRLGIIVDIALQKFQDIQTVTRVCQKCCEQNIEPIINGDEVVPIPSAALECALVFAKCLATAVSALEPLQNIFVCKTRIVQSNADACGEDRIYKTAPHRQPATVGRR